MRDRGTDFKSVPLISNRRRLWCRGSRAEMSARAEISASFSPLPPTGFSVLQDPHLREIKPKSPGLSFQPLWRLFDRVFRQVKRAPVNGHKALPSNITQELERLFRRPVGHPPGRAR